MPRRKNYVRSAVSAANMKLSVKAASLVLASSTLVSALLGIFRDRWLNSMYYDTYPEGLDAYTAAFTVPDFLYFVITSGALSVTFRANNMETIGGILTEDLTLESGHAYYVNDNLLVNKGVTLTIKPGARLEFARDKGLMSLGKLVAKGTCENPIVFTSYMGGDTWKGISTRKRTGKTSNRSLYTNSERTLFTIFPTESTPINVSSGFRETPYYDPSLGIAENRTFNLKDYMEDWDETDVLNGNEAFLTDPNYVTPAVLRMLEDFRNYCAKFGSGERSETRTDWVDIQAVPLSWITYDDYGDTIKYCRFESSEMVCDWNSYDYPYMENCLIIKGSYREALYGMSGIRNVLTENIGYERSVMEWKKKRQWNIVNNSHSIYGSGAGNLFKYSNLNNCNYFNNPAILPDYSSSGQYKGREYWLMIGSSEPTVDRADNPSYLGTSREDIVRPHVYELGNAPSATWGTVDLSNMRKTPVSEAHGIVWKVVVNNKDAQDEYEELAPLGVGRHKFEVYFNRPMNREVIPLISFGVRDPWTQNAVDEDGSWNAEGTIYTAYKTITGKTASDGVNRIYVRGAEDDEFFPCPYEKTRFNINVQAAGSMATGFAAEAGLGRVKLTWDNSENDIDDAMGYNVYRYCRAEGTDTIRINESILGMETSEYTDYDVIPNHTYYYLYKVLSTDLKEYDVSNIVAATPLTATLGDADGSGEVDVVDVVTTVNYVLGKKPDPFVFAAADVNADKNINVLDVVGIVQRVLSPNGINATSAIDEVEAVYTIEDGVLYVESPVALAGVQMLLNVSDKDKVFTVTSDLKGFERSATWLSDNDYLFMAYSMGGKTLSVGKHALLKLDDATISNIYLCDAKGKNVKAVAGEGATNIEAMGSKVQQQSGVFNLNGQKVAASESDMQGLKRGVYIINGQKVVR